MPGTGIYGLLVQRKEFQKSLLPAESLRRYLYTHPELKLKPFLSEDYSDKEFVNNHYSILKKPELLFLDSIERSELINHPLFTAEKKPFNTYDEALNYFCETTSSQGFNEANFTLALYNYSNKDVGRFETNVQLYLANSGGLNSDFAKKLLDNNKVTAPGKKLLFLFDNTGMYSEDNAWDSYNYVQAKSKVAMNKEIGRIVIKDTANTQLVLLNELLGKFPAELYRYQKIEQTIISLYTDTDRELYRKKRVSGRETPEELTLSHKFTKNLLIYAPEYYKFLTDNNIGSICFSNISYDYEGALTSVETRNDYTTYYLSFDFMRPYIKSGVRGGGNKKQSTPDIARDIADFLYGHE